VTISRSDDTHQGRDGPPNQVAVGTYVEVELVDETGARERLAFEVVPDDEADFAAGFLGVGTPLAQTLFGHGTGSVLPYHVGDIRQVKILTVAAGARTRADHAGASRQAIIQKAISKSDLAESVRFALTVDQKWGDTDPEGIASDWE
jgi:hypothetical protein